MTVEVRRDAAPSESSASWGEREVEIEGESRTALRGLLRDGPDASALLALAHGAGAPMTHRFMESLAEALAREGVATLRYNFPYAKRGRRLPDPPGVLLAAVGDAVAEARRWAEGRPLYAGGKSMGGRMTSTRLSEANDEAVRGIVFFGFPLHPPGRPAVARAAHLAAVRQPMLFHQGTRDRLADLDLLRSVLDPLGARVSLHAIQGADHGFVPLKRSGLTPEDVVAAVARRTAEWIADLERGRAADAADARG